MARSRKEKVTRRRGTWRDMGWTRARGPPIRGTVDILVGTQYTVLLHDVREDVASLNC